MNRPGRRLNPALLALALVIPSRPAAAQDWTIAAIRYATIRAFPVSSLVVGAPRGEQMDIAMIFWLLRGADRIVLLDNLERGRPSATFEPGDSTTNLAAQQRMIALAGSATRVVPGHDPLQFELFRTTGRVARISPSILDAR